MSEEAKKNARGSDRLDELVRFVIQYEICTNTWIDDDQISKCSTFDEGAEVLKNARIGATVNYRMVMRKETVFAI